MRIDFNEIASVTFPGMDNGTGMMSARMYNDDSYRIIPTAIHPGGSIGNHKQNSGDDMNYIISGTGKAFCDGTEEALSPGVMHICPKGGWAEDYPDPPGLLRDYPKLQETPSSGTKQRTKWNMRDADAILTIIPESSARSQGTEVGLEEGEHLGKPMFTTAGLKDVPEIRRWISTLSDGIELCVGGPRASECPEAYETAKAVLTAVLPVFDTSGRQAE